MPHGMQLVDLVIEEDSRLILVEVKDYADPAGRPLTTSRLQQAPSVTAAVNQQWVPKARDSYTYLHLMRRDDRPIVYVALVCEPRKLGNYESLDALGSQVLARCHHEAEEAWRHRYVTACVAVTPAEWKRCFHQYKLSLRRQRP